MVHSIKTWMGSLLLLALVLVSSATAGEHKLRGTLAAKPDGAAADVVAVLNTKGGTNKKDGTKIEAKTLKLIATGDVATQITTLLAKGANVEVTGAETPEGVKVATITEAVKGRSNEHERKRALDKSRQKKGKELGCD